MRDNCLYCDGAELGDVAAIWTPTEIKEMSAGKLVLAQRKITFDFENGKSNIDICNNEELHKYVFFTGDNGRSKFAGYTIHAEVSPDNDAWTLTVMVSGLVESIVGYRRPVVDDWLP